MMTHPIAFTAQEGGAWLAINGWRESPGVAAVLFDDGSIYDLKLYGWRKFEGRPKIRVKAKGEVV